MHKFRDSARNPLTESISPDELDQKIYGTVGGSLAQLDVGRVVAKPTPINEIWRDLSQPRRAIPATISMNADGNPAHVPDMLAKWKAVAEAKAQQSIDVIRLLNSEGDGFEVETFPPIAKSYVELVRLAAHIKANKLEHPISIIDSDSRLMIEAGERRWLAFHLLALYFGKEFEAIPAIKADGKNSVWRQAGENTQRSQLNAVSMARQFALLLMETLRDKVPFKSYEDIVAGGVSDRRFYAQVADGFQHRIPRGKGEAIQGAMHLSESQLRQYRKLLRVTEDEVINDALWVRGDVENWPETAFRDVATVTTVTVSEVISRENWTLDDLRALKESPAPKYDFPEPLVPPRRPVTSEWMNKRVVTKGGLFGTVVNVNGDWITVTHENGAPRKNYNYVELTITGERMGALPNIPAPRPAPVKPSFSIGDQVITAFGIILTVQGFENEGHLTLVNSPTNKQWRTVNTAELKRYMPPAVIDIDDPDEDADTEAYEPLTLANRPWSEGSGVAGGNKYLDNVPAVDRTELAIPASSKDAQLLLAYRASAVLIDDSATCQLIDTLLSTPIETLTDMERESSLADLLNDYHQRMIQAKEREAEEFTAVLRRIDEKVMSRLEK